MTGHPGVQETCWDRGLEATALNSVTIATTVVTMESLRRTGLVCTVIVIMVVAEVAGGYRDEFAQSQGETVSYETCIYQKAKGVLLSI